MDHESDRRRAHAVLAGDTAAFDAFFHEYFPRLYRYVLPRVDGRVEDAQDVCQETLLRALRRLHTYRGEAALFSWICRIASNQLSDFWRLNSRERARVVFTEDDPTVQAVLAALQSGEADDPEQQHSFTELCRVVQVTLDNLPGRFGDALEWKYLDGLSVADIAARLGLSPVAAQSLLQRAREAFREAFTAISEVTLGELLTPRRAPDKEV